MIQMNQIIFDFSFESVVTGDAMYMEIVCMMIGGGFENVFGQWMCRGFSFETVCPNISRLVFKIGSKHEPVADNNFMVIEVLQEYLSKGFVDPKHEFIKIDDNQPFCVMAYIHGIIHGSVILDLDIITRHHLVSDEPLINVWLKDVKWGIDALIINEIKMSDTLP